MDTQEWLREECPILVVYAPSSTGKTTLIASLFGEDSDYWPALFIDADEGAKTIAEFTKNPEIVDYRSKSKRPQGHTVYKWLATTLKEARTSEHKMIVIEGLTRFRDNLVSDFLIDNPDHVGKPRGIMTAYAEPSTLCGALFGGISKIQDVRKRNGTGGPIVVTLNAKFARHEEKGKPTIEYPVPNLSPNLIENLMGRADVFAELQRPPGKKTRLLTQFSELNRFRKCRNNAVAQALANMRGIKLDKLFDTWAVAEQKQVDSAAQWVAEENNEDTETENEDT